MMTWIGRTLVGGAVVLAAVGAVGAIGGCAGHSWHRHGHGAWNDADVAEMRGRAVERIASKLDLDAAQKAKLGALADEMIAQRRALRGDGGGARAEFGALLGAERFDRAAAQALVDRKLQAMQAGAPRLVAAYGEFHDSLNAEQRRRIRERFGERRGG